MTPAARPERQLRVLTLTGAYFPEIGSGGLQAQMVARAAGDRVEFRVLTTAVDPTLPRHQVIDGVAVSRIAVNADSLVSKIQAADQMLREAVALLRESDVVHLHGYSQKNVLVSALARILRVPIVLSLHTAGFDEPATIAAQGALARWSFNAAKVYVAVSPRLKEACAAAGIPESKVRYVPNGVDLTRFHPAAAHTRPELRRSLGLEPTRPAVLFVGFFSREKQPDVLFDGWLRLQDTPQTASTLVMVGATRSRYFEVDERIAGEMRARAQAAGVADRLVFVEPTHRIHEYYRAADVFVLPSRREGLPVALLEAMACGLPVVASRLPGATDVVVEDERSGLLVTPGDVDALSAAIRRVLSDRSFADTLGASARRRIEADFGAARVADQWIAAYRDVMTEAA